MSATPSARSKPIADYAAIGNCRSVALVAKDGAIEFLCWPRFDTPALFAALIDAERDETFRIRSSFSVSFSTERRYVDGTAVLQKRKASWS